MLWWVALAFAEPGSVQVEIGTDVPLAISAGAVAEVGPRLRLRASVGWLPPAYVSVANTAAQAVSPGYTDPYADLVAFGLQHALVTRLHVGWRPWAQRGFYTHAGWTLAAMGGEGAALEVVEAVTGRQLPSFPLLPAPQVSLLARETVHFADLELGWDQAIGEGPFHVRAGLGWSFTVGARASLKSETPLTLPGAQLALDELLAEGEAELEAATRAYVHPPVVSVAVGWRFGGT